MDQTTPLATAAMPRLSESDIASAREKIAAYLADAQSHGIALRPITGQIIRLAARAELDLEQLGADIDEIDDEVYFESVTLAAWMLCEDPAAVIAAVAEGPDVARNEAQLWAMGHLDTIEREGAAMRCFIARWLEYRVEMQILKQRSEAE